MDLHPKAGQRALKEAGLFEDFKRHARPEDQSLKLVKYTGEVLWDESEPGNARPEEYDDRPEIDRVKLREILLDSIEPRTIKWNHKVSKIEADPNAKGKHTIFFANGTQEKDFDLVIGADGAWSKVRPLVSDVQPHYSGITAAELWAGNVRESHPWLSEYVRVGSTFMFDEGRALMCQRNGNDSIRVYACVRRPETWKDNESGIDWSDHDSVRKVMAEEYFADCGADIKLAILQSTDECIGRKLYELPVDHTWTHRPGVTLLGDAAHLMTPFAGVGVNLAMLDALKLAEQLIAKKNGLIAKAFSHERNIDVAVKAYEKEMFGRSREYAEKTARNMEEHFSRDGGETMTAKLKGRMAE